MSWRGQGVWVLGTGFLGSALAAVCRAAGASVLTIDHAAPADLHADAADAKAMAVGLGRVVPQVAFCCLSTRGGDAAAYRHVYLQSMRSVLSVAPAVCPVFCSSVSLYPDAGGGAVDENTPLSSPNSRQEVLRQAEALVLSAGGLVVRLAPLYGAGRCELLRRHLAGEPRLPGPPERWLNYLHVDDAVQGLMQLAARKQSGVYNLCSESFTHAAAYEMMQQLTGVPAAAECTSASVRGSASRRIVSTRFSPESPRAFRDFVLAEMQCPTLS